MTLPVGKTPPSSRAADPAAPRRAAALPHLALRQLHTLRGLLQLAWWRLRYYSGLSLLALIGIILAVGLVTSAAFFAQAVDQVMLDRELAEYTRITQRPPFAARVFVASSPTVPLTLSRVEALGRQVADTLGDEVGLPVREVVLFADSGNRGVFPRADDTRYTTPRALVAAAALYVSDLAPNIQIELGAPYIDQDADQDAPNPILNVWLHQTLGEQLGVQIGDTFELDIPAAQGGRVPFQVAGLWTPIDPKAAFWFNDPNQLLVEKLIVTRADYERWVAPSLNPQVRTATWQIILDESAAIPAKARDYKEGFERAGTLIPRYLPDVRITTPTLTLEKFVGQQTALTTLLLGFNVPGLGFLLYFLILTSAVIAYWQRRETSVLRSRGISRSGILNFTFFEAVILFLVGAPIGLGVGLLLARGMGYTTSFLNFTLRAPLPVSLNGINLPLTLATLGIVLIAKLWTTGASANATIVTQTREHARPTQGPFWYRYYLDLFLLIPTFYAYQQLLNRGSLAALVQDRPEDLYQDPLLILVPGLFIISLALLAMRLFPLLMRILDQVARWVGWMPGYLGLRQLGRQSHAYINPLLLVIVSLALGVYTLSMAASLDRWLGDRVFHAIGSDYAFTPFSETDAMGEFTPGAEWMPPIDEFRLLPGVVQAARVADYDTEISIPTGQADRRIAARFMAIDRLDFPLAAWHRSDYARESMGALMNRLALHPDGILVSQAFLDTYGYQIGDRVAMLIVPDFSLFVRESFTIVGVYTYFPTVQNDETVVVGNLDYIISFFGITMPHDIWLRLEPGTDRAALPATIATTGVATIDVRDAADSLGSAQAQLERVGVFGTLTVSFLAAALMAALGLLTYSYASLHERLYLFSVLRAVGLARKEIVSQVALEYVVLTAYGAVAGVLCGSLAARLFVPLFRMSGDTGTPLPPLLPVIDQERILPLVLVFSVVMIGLELLIISTAFYRRLATALRMGHQG